VAVPLAVAMSNVTPPGPAVADRLTVKVAVVVPALPSTMSTSSMVSVGRSSLSTVPLAGAGAPNG